MAQIETHIDSSAWSARAAALRNHLAGLRVMHAARRLHYLARKAGFNPNQPRVPRGNPDGGQWTQEGGGGTGTSTSKPKRPRTSVPNVPRKKPELRVPIPDTAAPSGEEIGKPPTIPREKPHLQTDLQLSKRLIYTSKKTVSFSPCIWISK